MGGTNGNGPFALTETSFRGVDAADNDVEVNANAANGNDSLIFNGTDGDDVISLASGGDGGTDIRNVIGSTIMSRLEAFNIDTATVRGLDGDDTFNVTTTLPFNLSIEGGNPSASDTVNLNNASGDVNVSLGDGALSTDTTVTGYGSAVSLSGIEVANLNASGNGLAVNGNSTIEAIEYTPNGSQSGSFVKTGLNTVFNFTNVANAFTIDPVSGNDAIVVNGTSSGDDITVSQSGPDVNVVVGGFKALTMPAANVQALVINGGLGDDTLTVDSTNGPVLVPVTYDGNGGSDSLVLSGGTALGDSYTVGPQIGSGTSSIIFAGGTQTVQFSNLEPVIDLVTAPSFNIIATNGDNAINYTAGNLTGANGLVTVDDHESIEFSNKTNLLIDALAGNDTINLHNSNPTPPTGLTGIIVTGGDPTASDTLIVNGTGGVDAITYGPTGIGSGSVGVSGMPGINFATIEHLIINGQGGGDTLAIDSTSIDGTQVFTPGASNDAGTVDFQDNLLANFIGTSLEFLGLGNSGRLTSSHGVPGGPRSDSFIYRGTDLADAFTLTGLDASTGRINLGNRLPVEVSDMIQVTLAGLDGDDTFNLVNGPNGLPFDAVTIDGGNPSASDIVNLNGATGAVAVSLANSSLPTNTVVSGYGLR